MAQDVDLSKEATELIGSRLSGKNLLAPGTMFSFHRRNVKDVIPFFQTDGDFVYWADAEGLLGAVGFQYEADEWSLFTDSSKQAYNMPCNGSHFASVPVLSS